MALRLTGSIDFLTGAITTDQHGVYSGSFYNCNIEWNGTSWNASTALPKNLRGMGAAGTPSAGVVYQGLEYYSRS